MATFCFLVVRVHERQFKLKFDLASILFCSYGGRSFKLPAAGSRLEESLESI